MLKKINKSKLEDCDKCFDEYAKNQLKDMGLRNQNNTLYKKTEMFLIK